jgi:hypothetical protein
MVALRYPQKSAISRASEFGECEWIPCPDGLHAKLVFAGSRVSKPVLRERSYLLARRSYINLQMFMPLALQVRSLREDWLKVGRVL